MRPQARFVVVLLALAVCLGGVGVAVGQSGSGHGQETIVSIPNTTNQLSPVSVATDGHSFTGLDVGTAIAADATRLAGLHERQILETALAADDESDRRIAVRNAITTLEQQAVALGQRRQALLRAHADGDLSTRGLVRELVRLNAAADRSRARYNQLSELSRDQAITGLDVETRIRSIEAMPQQFEQPALDRIAAAVAGAATPQTVYVQGGPDDLLVGTIGEDYVRQTLVSSERNASRTNQFIDADGGSGWPGAISRVEQLYPWAFNSNEGIGGGSRLGEKEIYGLTLEHEQGTLRAYLDSATTNALYEYQRLVPERVPVTTTRSVTNGGVELQVMFTHSTGPARISVTDGTGAVSGATITVNDQRVDLTDSSGSAWIIQPGGTDKTFRITVTTPDGRVVSVSGS